MVQRYSISLKANTWKFILSIVTRVQLNPLSFTGLFGVSVVPKDKCQPRDFSSTVSHKRMHICLLPFLNKLGMAAYCNGKDKT